MFSSLVTDLKEFAHIVQDDSTELFNKLKVSLDPKNKQFEAHLLSTPEYLEIEDEADFELWKEQEYFKHEEDEEVSAQVLESFGIGEDTEEDEEDHFYIKYAYALSRYV